MTWHSSESCRHAATVPHTRASRHQAPSKSSTPTSAPLGACVTLFTRSASKAEEGRRQGADHVIVSTDAEQMQAAAGHFDFLLDTIPVQHDLNPYLDTLRFEGVHTLAGLIELIDPPGARR